MKPDIPKEVRAELRPGEEVLMRAFGRQKLPWWAIALGALACLGPGFMMYTLGDTKWVVVLTDQRLLFARQRLFSIVDVVWFERDAVPVAELVTNMLGEHAIVFEPGHGLLRKVRFPALQNARNRQQGDRLMAVLRGEELPPWGEEQAP